METRERTWTLHGVRAIVVVRPVLPPTRDPGHRVRVGLVKSWALEWAHLGVGQWLGKGVATGQEGAHR